MRGGHRQCGTILPYSADRKGFVLLRRTLFLEPTPRREAARFFRVKSFFRFGSYIPLRYYVIKNRGGCFQRRIHSCCVLRVENYLRV